MRGKRELVRLGVTGKGGAVPMQRRRVLVPGYWYRYRARRGLVPARGGLARSGAGGARRGMLAQSGGKWGGIGYWGERRLYWGAALARRGLGAGTSRVEMWPGAGGAGAGPGSAPGGEGAGEQSGGLGCGMGVLG